MLSTRIRKVLAMTMAIAVMESFIGIKPIITSAYAEEKELNEILFKDAQEKLIEKLDEEITKGSSEEDAIGILEKFDYSYNVTSGEAVTIGAGNISELKNDESGCYFNAKLYNNLISESYNFNYSNLYSSIMLMRNANSEFCLDKGNIVIEESQIGYYDDSGNLINKPIDSSVSLFITQNDDSETSNTITVKSGTHTIVLNGINIKDCNGPAIDIQEDSKVTLELNRENNISSTSFAIGYSIYYAKGEGNIIINGGDLELFSNGDSPLKSGKDIIVNDGEISLELSLDEEYYGYMEQMKLQ